MAAVVRFEIQCRARVFKVLTHVLTKPSLKLHCATDHGQGGAYLYHREYCILASIFCAEGQVRARFDEIYQPTVKDCCESPCLAPLLIFTYVIDPNLKYSLPRQRLTQSSNTPAQQTVGFQVGVDAFLIPFDVQVECMVENT